MSTFRLELHDSTGLRTFDRVYSFVGTDASGSFGLRAGHARFMTVLAFGLARFREEEASWTYLALPGAVVDFQDNTLWIAARRSLLDADYCRINVLLREQLLAEERALEKTRSSLRQMEEELLRRLWRLGKEGG